MSFIEGNSFHVGEKIVFWGADTSACRIMKEIDIYTWVDGHLSKQFLFFLPRNGPEFEARIRQNEINNPKFNFLNPNDPYHAYYRHKVSEFKEGKAQEPSAAIPKVMQQQQSAQQQLPQKVSVPVASVENSAATGCVTAWC